MARGSARPSSAAAIVVCVAVAAAFAALALGLARSDAELGTPYGPDRRVLAGSAIDATPGQQRADANAALSARPVDGGAMRLLALAADAEGDADHALALHERAVALDPREPVSRAMLVDAAFAHGNLDGATRHLDAMLRSSPDVRVPVLDALVPNLAEPGVRTAVAARLALDPPWRGDLLRALRKPGVAPAIAADMLGDLAGVTALTPSEQGARVDALIALGRVADARRAWVAALPAPLRKLDGEPFDAGFDAPEPMPGFGWTWRAQPGVTLGPGHVDGEPTDARAFVARFSGRAVDFTGPMQRLALAPGRYTLAVRARDGTESPRGFAWQVDCEGGGGRLLQLELDHGDGDWREQAADFEVPDTCPLQVVRLRHTGRSLAERGIRGTLAIDEVRLNATGSD